MKNQEIQTAEKTAEKAIITRKTKFTKITKIALVVGIIAFSIIITYLVTAKKVNSEWGNFIIQGDLMQVSGDMYSDPKCTKRIKTSVNETCKFGRKIQVVNHGIKYDVIEVVWTVDGKTLKVFFRAD